MIQTIRVAYKDNTNDLHASDVLRSAKNFLANTIYKVETARVYRLEGITEKHAEILAQKLFCEEINQNYTLNKPIIKNATVVEIAYKPGVMNPEVASIIKAAHDLQIDLKAADSSREYGFFGKVNIQDLYALTAKLNLYNNIVEHIVEKDPETLLITGIVGETTTIPIRNMTHDQLMALSKDALFLNLEEMKVIQKYFRKIKRDPTDCELETLAQTWSEHCNHKTFKAQLTIDGKKKQPLITRIKKEALIHKKNIVSAFVDNSGVMEFYDGYSLCGKAETHNSPSAIEPYGGAMTGSGGVFRDIVGTGKGAKAIVSTDVFCFAPPHLSSHKLPSGCLPPDYLLKRVVTGVKDYGNRMGIPTNNGSIHFHEDFRAKPTVLVGAYGILPKKYAQKGTPKVGDIVISMGGRTGRDGIHGATFSSGEMTDRTINVNSSAVQIGNAIEEKRLFDALLEARDTGCIRAIQDCGAGGFSSAIGEMGENTGVTIDLKKVPLKYQGLSPWEIWVSESQERMILAVPKEKLSRFKKLCKKNNVELQELGVFDDSKKLNVYYGKNPVCILDMAFLHHGLPQRHMVGKKPNNGVKKIKEPSVPTSEKEWISRFQKILSHGNVCSKEPIVRLYDHSVQGTNDLQPYSGVKLDGPNDAVVIRPILNKSYGMITSHGLNPILNRIDPYWGSMWAATEALANYVAVGGNYKHASLINNYIWPFPDEESLWSLDQSVDAVVDFMKALKIPVISGKDSLSSTYRNKDGTVIKIPPVLCMSVFGKIPDTAKTITADFKESSSIICLVGNLDHAMGGSVYFDTQGLVGNSVPKVDLKILPYLFEEVHTGIINKKIVSCHDVSEGGVLTTIFEMCVGGNLGADITIQDSQQKRIDYILFNETAGCFVVELENESVAKKLFKKSPYIIIGKTINKKYISVSYGEKNTFKESLSSLKSFWKKPMQLLFP